MKREVTESAGRSIRKLRRDNNYSLQELANATGMRWQKLKRYEDGDRKVPLVVIVDICEVLDHPPIEFVENILSEEKHVRD